MEKLVIIGSGMAGGKLVEEILEKSKNIYDITVIGDEPYGNYDRIKLISILKEEEPEKFWLNSESWYVENGVKAILGDAAKTIDSSGKTVTTDGDKIVSYDKLVMATGSKALIPKMKGSDLDGVFKIRNLTDIENIKNFIKDKQDVLVIGGGLLGLELAYALYETGKSVTVSHLKDSLMEVQLNKEAAGYLLKRLKALGINFVMDNYITELTKTADGKIEALFNDGFILESQAVIVNCGISPNKELAEKSGLKTGKGIIVDNKLQTSDGSIYAIGECIEYNGKLYGIIAPIYEQVRTLAKTLLGEECVYPDSTTPPVKLKSEVSAIAMGKLEAEEGDDEILYNNPKSCIFKKLIVRDNVIQGAHLVGEDLNSDAIGVYYMSKLPTPNRIEQLLFPGVHKPGSASLSVYWPNSVTICDCNGVTCETLRESIRKYGSDVDMIMKDTKAGTSCGTCKNRIQSIIDNTYDAIIIGAGLGGLSAAAKLAKSGKKVIVIEKHDKAGGYATSFSREGYKFDVSLHNIGPMNGSLKKIFDELGLSDKLKYIPYESFQRIIFPDYNINIPTGENKFAEELCRLFPDEKDGILQLFDEVHFIRRGFDEFEELSMSGDPEQMNNPMMAIKYPQFVELAEKTYGEFLSKYIKDEKLKSVLSNFWWYGGLPPDRLASLIYIVTSVNYFENAGGYIEGSSQELSNALADVVVGARGRVLLDTEVKKILIADGKVNGVLTDQGEIFYSDMVISNANALDTYVKLTEENQIKKRIRRKVEELEYSLSAIQLYLGLDCDPAELSFTDHSFAVFPEYDHEKNYQSILSGDYENCFLSCSNYTKIDPKSSPEGKGIITIISLDHIKNWENLSAYEYQKRKNRVTEIFIKRVEKYLPGLSKHIVVKELGTPKTMYRYTFNPKGSIYGPSHIVDQSGMRRLPTFTSIKGLFVVGSTIYPGGGYPSVIGSGYKTANMIIFAENKKND